MVEAPTNTAGIKTTSYKVVLPFYVYAALSFLIATIFLFICTDAFSIHYFHPHILAVTHILALGWGTMIILGASHQLVPVLIEGKLFSEKLAYLTFIFAAIGIPLLVYGFFIFTMGETAKWGGGCMLFAIFTYLVNIGVSISKGKRQNIQAAFIFTAVLWLFFTASLGLILVYNFRTGLLSHDSLHYLPLHAHAGIIGWFLLLVIGVGSRLIPMFLISKYTNARLLWIIYSLNNAALLSYLIIFYTFKQQELSLIPTVLLLIAVLLFISYCYQSYQQRIRKHVDEQMKISLLSVIMILLPVILLCIMIAVLYSVSGEKTNFILCYGFVIFCGWLTAIILGMTFKTLPFIVWNKVYHRRSALGKTPNPKDLFSHSIFRIMSAGYLLGFGSFACGIIVSSPILLKTGAVLLIMAALLYNVNVIKILTHKPVI